MVRRDRKRGLRSADRNLIRNKSETQNKVKKCKYNIYEANHFPTVNKVLKQHV